MARVIDSTSDDRVANNVIRHEYRTLSETEKRQMQEVKDAGFDFVQLLHEIGGTASDQMQQASRELALAQTKIEEAVMWTVKHITR